MLLPETTITAFPRGRYRPDHSAASPTAPPPSTTSRHSRKARRTAFSPVPRSGPSPTRCSYQMIRRASISFTTHSPEFRSEVKMWPLWICAPHVMPQLGTVVSASVVLRTAISLPCR